MISFIGAGKVGKALGVYFKQKGFKIGGYYSRTSEHAKEGALRTNSVAFTNIQELLNNSRMVWITVSDDALPIIAKEIAQLEVPVQVEAFIHTSGVHSSKTLEVIKSINAYRYCAHPLMAFNNVDKSLEQLNNTYFSIETSAQDKNKAIGYLNSFFTKTGNSILQIDSDKKELYHCAATVLSNYMVTLLNASYELFAKSGMTPSEIKRATAPLLKSTLNNIANNEQMSDALTGAIKRGDSSTVKKHINALKLYLPDKVNLYKELGKETMHMLNDFRLKEYFE